MEGELGDDLFQEFILILLEYPEEKLKDVYDRGILDWFCSRILFNQSSSKTSPFYKQYKKFASITSDIDNFNLTYEPDNKMLDLISIIDQELIELEQKDQPSRYHSLLFRNYFKGAFNPDEKNLTIRYLSSNTGIPLTTVHKDIKWVKNYLKDKCGDIA